MRSRLLPVVVLLVAFFPLGSIALGDSVDYSFTGNFTQDDDVQLFSFTVGSTSTITLRTLSYAGGTNADGSLISAGGFDPILSLFDSSGLQIYENDDGGPPDVGIDLVVFLAFDTFLQVELTPGIYTAAISQYDNFANGPTLGDGFSRDGQGNFAGGFIDYFGNQRTNEWAFDILNVEGAYAQHEYPETPVPEPSTLTLMGFGILAGGVFRKKFKSMPN